MEEATAPKTNSARRIYEILEQAQSHQAQNNQPTTLGMWGAVLAGRLTVAGGSDADNEDAVLPLLAELRSQIRAVDALRRSDPDYQRLLAPLITGALRVTGTNVLHSPWSEIKAQQLQPPLVSGWGLFSKSLPMTEDVITPEQLNELTQAIDALASAAQSDSLPQDLRAFALEQVRVLREAMLKYRISGAPELRKALAAGVGELIRDAEVLRESSGEQKAESAGVWTALRAAWHKAAEVCDDMDKYRRGAEEMGRLSAPFLKVAMPLIEHWVSGGGSGQ